MLSSFTFAHPEITPRIEALKGFQDFEPALRRGANTLKAAEIGITQLHFYASANLVVEKGRYHCPVCGEHNLTINWEPKQAFQQQRQQRQQRQQAVAQLLQAQALTDWERGFLKNVRKKGKLSPLKTEVLARIEAKLGGAV